MAKQGRAGRDVYESSKREPRSKSVSLAAVSRLGALVPNGTPFKTLYNSDGTLQAPMAGSEVYPGGSQTGSPKLSHPKPWRGRK